MTLFTREPQHRQWIGLITLIGLALRLYGLSAESYWLDEIVAAMRVHESLRNLFFGWDSETQGPLYYLLIKGWGLVFGTHEWTLRLWSVIFGTLTIPFIYLLGRQLFSGTAALLAALFISIHPFAIHYSQEARPYALFLLLSLLSYHYLLLLMRQHRWPLAWTYILVTAAAFYTHAFGMFLVLSHLVIFRLFRRESRFRGALRSSRPYYLSFALLFVSCLPELAQNALAALKKMSGPSTAGWIPEPHLTWLFKLPAEYFMDTRLGAIVLLVTSLLAIVRLLSEPQLRAGFKWLAIVGTCMWLVPWIVSVTLTPVFVMRYMAPGLLVVVFLMATAAASLQQWPRRLFVTFLVVLTAFPLWNYFTKVDKDPWRQTSEYLAERVKPGDVIISNPRFVRPSLAFYLPDELKPQYIRPSSVADLEAALATATRVWEISSYSTQDSASLAMMNTVKSWGTELRRVKMNEMLKMNPNRFWSAPIEIALKENKHPEMGPEPLSETEL